MIAPVPSLVWTEQGRECQLALPALLPPDHFLKLPEQQFHPAYERWLNEDPAARASLMLLLDLIKRHRGAITLRHVPPTSGSTLRALTSRAA